MGVNTEAWIFTHTGYQEFWRLQDKNIITSTLEYITRVFFYQAFVKFTKSGSFLERWCIKYTGAELAEVSVPAPPSLPAQRKKTRFTEVLGRSAFELFLMFITYCFYGGKRSQKVDDFL